MELNKVKLICKQRFPFEGKIYFYGEVTHQIERIARRWVSRGIADYADPNASTRNGYTKHDKVSIIILVKDALEYVKKCIESLNRYTNNFELIIIDNGSNSETKKWLKNLDWLDFTLITNKENKGISYGWDQGIKVAKYDYICFLNSDTLLSPNWLGKLMRGFKYDGKVGIVGPSTCHCATIQSPQVWKNFKTASQQKVNEISDMLKEDYNETVVVGFCFVFKKEVFDKIGVFDYKRYGLACHEDIDLVWRALKAGFKSIWCMGSYVHHFGNRTTREMGLDPHKIRIENKSIFNERIKDNELYIENDVEVEQIEAKVGTIPILMITWNRLEYTKQAIKSIIDNSDLPFKLFIFDNNSADDTKEYLENLKNKQIEIFHSKKNTGLVPPMNYFFNKFCNYKYVAKVDNDTIVGKDWLSKLKEVLDEYPLLAVEGNHYLMLSYNIKENDDYFKCLFSVDFKDGKLYFSDLVGGTGTLIRTALIDEIPEMEGSLSGWIQYQVTKQIPSAFYTGVWINRLDQIGTNKYKEVSDFPGYDKKMEKLRPKKKISSKPIHNGLFRDTYNRMKEWYERL